ncbi:protein polyglycylase TTLL10 [Echinococcus multilocularis]|uniref:Protein polyglycylase TTLL10 n=1 Tax=Echinococcus multilocularis TaxID=6211 RepID=A0A068Y5P7_ECHMU|nr:protein polyglycylase TTLL10 [Echinococcus multilocularis]
MGQTSAKRIQNHISAMEGAGYTVDEKLATKLRNSLTKLNIMSDDDGQLMCILPVPNDVLDSDQAIKKEIQQQLSLPRPKFFLNCYNGSHIVLPLLFRLEWNRIIDKRGIGHCCFRWTETVMQLNYQVFRECEQMVNHIPNCGLFTNKLGLLMSLRKYADDCKRNSRKDVSVNFIPETYWIDDAKEKAEFINKLSDHQIWLMKPCGLNQGKGICLIRSQQDFVRLEEARSEEIRRNPQMCRPRIVQKYLTTPLLLNNRKFDIRCYFMISSTMPYLVLFTPGYIRLSLRKYDPADTNLVTHLTNQFIQKRDPSYDRSKDDSVWTFRKLNEYINTNVAPNKHLQKNWVTRHMLPEMHRITMHVFNAVKDKLACRIGFFEIYGMDFMIDDDMKIWLIEINSNPAMNTNCEVLRQVIPPVLNRFIQISIECFEKARRWQPLLPILGILPRNPSELGEERDSYTWNVSLRPPPKYITNGGLPASFTILFNESLTAAKSRQSRCYSTPLRLWVPPKMYLTAHLPKPGLVIRRSPSPPSHSSASLPRISAIPHKYSALATMTSKPSPPRTEYQKPPAYSPREMRFFRSSSHKITSGSESSRHSTERESIQTQNLQESSLGLQIASDLGANQSITSDKTDVPNVVAVAEEPLAQEQVHKLPDPQNEPGKLCDEYLVVILDGNFDANGKHQMDPKRQEVTGTQSRGSNESNTLLRLIQDGVFKWTKRGTVGRDSSAGVELPIEDDVVTSNNSSSVSTHATPRRRKLRKNRNDSCSVRIPPLMPEYVLMPISPVIMPPLPPLVLAATLPTEMPNEQPEENETNSGNELIDLSNMRAGT